MTAMRFLRLTIYGYVNIAQRSTVLLTDRYAFAITIAISLWRCRRRVDSKRILPCEPVVASLITPCGYKLKVRKVMRRSSGSYKGCALVVLAETPNTFSMCLPSAAST